MFTPPSSLSMSAPFSSTSSTSSSPSSSVPSLSSSTSIWTHFLVALVLALICTSSVSEACFIRNCPKGGKRSLGEEAIARRQCMPCGAFNTGQCVGSAICCSPSFGCHFGTRETEVCQKENQSLEPCYVTGDVCGLNDGGNCVADGICCDSDSCAFNERCRQKSVARGETRNDRSNILRLINKLLRTKSLT